MFYEASAFNQLASARGLMPRRLSRTRLRRPIGDWQTGAATSMHYMFYKAYAFNQLASAPSMIESPRSTPVDDASEVRAS